MLSEPLPDDLRQALQETVGRRGRFGDRVLFLPETGSTNDVAVALAQEGAPEGTLVVAGSQTAGRGRLGREWFSPPGAGLYLSIICRHSRVLPFASLIGGIGAADGILRATGLPVTLKWPNDVVVPDRLAPGGRRKLAGILAEGTGGADGLEYVVVGCGVNLRPAAYPPALAPHATSLEAELGRTVESGWVLAEILAAFAEQATAVGAGDEGRMLRRWRELAPSAVGSHVEWVTGTETRRGTTAGIDVHGALLIRTARGVERLVSGEVRWK